MARTATRMPARAVHPLHAVFLAFPFPLFLGGLLSDWAYWSTQHVQWINFAAWLIAGALLLGAVAVAWSLIDLLRHKTARATGLIYAAVLALMWVLGFINALVHAKDAWATMPTGLILSIIVTILALAAIWIGLSRSRRGEIS